MAITSQVNMKALLKSQQLSINENVNSKALETQSIVQTETSEIDSAVSSINNNVESLTTVNGDISTEVQAVNVHTNAVGNEIVKAIELGGLSASNLTASIKPTGQTKVKGKDGELVDVKSSSIGQIALKVDDINSNSGRVELLNTLDSGLFFGCISPNVDGINGSGVVKFYITINGVEYTFIGDFKESSTTRMFAVGGLIFGPVGLGYGYQLDLSKGVKFDTLKVEVEMIGTPVGGLFDQSAVVLYTTTDY